jgi:prolipoprotein diacylglyceryltransferase
MTTDTGMVERVAAAIAAAGGSDWSKVPKRPGPGFSMYQMYMGMARAALECLRTPTPEMVEAMIEEDTKPGRYFSQLMSDLFTAAIDAVLSPSKGEGE